MLPWPIIPSSAQGPLPYVYTERIYTIPGILIEKIREKAGWDQKTGQIDGIYISKC